MINITIMHFVLFPDVQLKVYLVPDVPPVVARQQDPRQVPGEVDVAAPELLSELTAEVSTQLRELILVHNAVLTNGSGGLIVVIMTQTPPHCVSHGEDKMLILFIIWH